MDKCIYNAKPPNFGGFFCIKTPAKIIMEIKGNMTEQDAGFCGKVFVFAISISCVVLGIGLAVSAIIFALRW